MGGVIVGGVTEDGPITAAGVAVCISDLGGHTTTATTPAIATMTTTITAAHIMGTAMATATVIGAIAVGAIVAGIIADGAAAGTTAAGATADMAATTVARIDPSSQMTFERSARIIRPDRFLRAFAHRPSCNTATLLAWSARLSADNAILREQNAGGGMLFRQRLKAPGMRV